MLPNIDYSGLPRSLQRLLTRGNAHDATMMPRRSFLKLAGAGGLALGAFPTSQLPRAPLLDREPAPSSRHNSRRPSCKSRPMARSW